MRWKDDIWKYIWEYLNDGLTNNYLKAWSHSPRGVLTLLKSRYERARNIDGVKKSALEE